MSRASFRQSGVARRDFPQIIRGWTTNAHPATSAKVVVLSKEEANKERAGVSFGVPGPLARRSGRKAVLLLSLRPMRSSPCFAYSVPKIGKGSLCPPSDLTRVFSLAALLFPSSRSAALRFVNRSWGCFRRNPVLRFSEGSRQGATASRYRAPPPMPPQEASRRQRAGTEVRP